MEASGSDVSVCVALLKPVGRLTSPSLSSISSCSGTLFPSGDILISHQGRQLSLFKEAVFCARPVVSEFEVHTARFTSLSTQTVFYTDDRGNRHFIGCTESGAVVFVLSGEDDRVSVIEYQLALSDSDEKITSMTCIGSVCVLGSSRSELYVVGRDISSTSVTADGGVTTRVFSYVLRRPRSLIYGLVESGARMFGLDWGESAPVSMAGVVRVLPLSLQSGGVGYLVAAGERAMCLWKLGEGVSGGLEEEGGHELLWEVDLRSALDDDMRRQLGNTISSFTGADKRVRRQFTLVDVAVVSPVSPCPSSSDDSGRAGLILLSVSEGGSGSEMWIHGVDLIVPTVPPDTPPRPAEVCNIRLRRRVAVGLDTTHRPSLIRCGHDGASMYVTWMASTSSGSTVHVIEVSDLQHYLSAQSVGGDMESPRQAQRSHPSTSIALSTSNTGSDDSAAYSHYLLLHDTAAPSTSSQLSTSSMSEGVGSNTGIQASSLLSISSVTASRGASRDITLVLRDGSLISCKPPVVSAHHLFTTLPQAVSQAPLDPVQILLRGAAGKATVKESYSALLASKTGGGSGQCHGAFSDNDMTVLSSSACTASRLIVDSDDSHSVSSAPAKSRARQDSSVLDRTAVLPSGRSLHERLERHTRLLEIMQQILLSAPGEEGNEASGGDRIMPAGVVENHNLLLGAVVLCSQLQEMQRQGSSDVSADGTSDVARQNLMKAGETVLLDAVREGMRAEVEERVRSGQRDLLKEGWSLGDVFFTQPSRLCQGLCSIAKALHGKFKAFSLSTGRRPHNTRGIVSGPAAHGTGASSSLSSSQLLTAAYCLCSLLMGVVRAPVEAEGGEDVEGDMEDDWNDARLLSLARSSHTRRAVLLVLEVLRYSCEDCRERGTVEVGDIIRRKWEGKRVYDLCYALLMSHELSIAVGSVQSISKSELNSLEDFHLAKNRAGGTLVAFGHAEAVFSLSVRFQWFEGIVKSSLDMDPMSLRPKLQRLLTEMADTSGTVDPFPTTLELGEFCLNWLEEQGRLVELLRVGKYAPVHMDKFLKTRPYIGWLRALEEKKYALGAEATLEHCAAPQPEKLTTPSLSTKKTLLSIGKLCAWAGVMEASDQITCGENGGLETIERLDTALLLVRAAECLRKRLGSNDRVDKGFSEPKSAVSSLLDAVDTSDDDSVENLADSALPIALRLLLISFSSDNDPSLSKLLRRIWRAAVSAEMSLWISVAATSIESRQELQMRKTLVYRLLRETIAYSAETAKIDTGGLEVENLPAVAWCLNSIHGDEDIVPADKFDDTLTRKQMMVTIRKCAGIACH